MQIFPAIDLSGGQVVRLYQGDYDQMTVYGSDPCAVAREFITAGAKYLHVVDLDGAKDGTLANFESIAAIAKQGGLYIEVGGGIRTEERIQQYLDLGVGRCILGTIFPTRTPGDSARSKCSAAPESPVMGLMAREKKPERPH